MSASTLTRCGRPWIVVAMIVLAGAASGCRSGDDSTAGTTSTAVTAVRGEVALVALTTGDCLDGVTIGSDEETELTSAEMVPCRGPHDLEVFASFELTARLLDVDDLTAFPGRPSVTDAATEGCLDLMEDAVGDTDTYGTIAIWPTDRSWSAGDRMVACAAFLGDGGTFDRPTLVGT